MDKIKIPTHLGIIIDGNRRWAKKHNLPTIEGHRQGFRNVDKISEFARKLGVKILTIYVFSTENWKRPKKEIKYLMKLLSLAFNKKYIDKLIKDEIQIRILGEIEKLPKKLQQKIKKAEEKTKSGKKGILNLAISYGGRAEIIQALKKIIKKKIPADKITEKVISENLWTAGLPDPDLIIRTGGHLRLSNFLTWQSTYSELYFTDKYWPDFTEKDLLDAFADFSKRKRNFGC